MVKNTTTENGINAKKRNNTTLQSWHVRSMFSPISKKPKTIPDECSHLDSISSPVESPVELLFDPLSDQREEEVSVVKHSESGGSALYDQQMMLHNVRTLVNVTKSKTILRTITNNEISLTGRGKEKVKISNSIVVGRLVLDAFEIDKRGKNGLMYKMAKYILLHQDRHTIRLLDNMLGEEEEGGEKLDTPSMKLVFSMVSDRLLRLLTPAVIDRVEKLFVRLEQRDHNTLILPQSFYFGGSGHFTTLVLFVGVLTPLLVTIFIDGEERRDFEREGKRIKLRLSMPLSCDGVAFQVRHLRVLIDGVEYTNHLHLLSFRREKVLSNLLNVILCGKNGTDRHSRLSLLSSYPFWRGVREDSSLVQYYKYTLNEGSDWSYTGSDPRFHSLAEFFLETNCYHVPISVGCVTDFPSDIYVFTIKMLIDLFYYYNDYTRTKHPVIDMVERSQVGKELIPTLSPLINQ